MTFIYNENAEADEYMSLKRIFKIQIEYSSKLYSFAKYILISFFIIVFCLNYIYTSDIYKIKNIDKEENFNKSIELEIDNSIKENQYENNINYTFFSTKIKTIAIYYPNIYLNNFLDKISSSNRNKNIYNYYFFDNRSINDNSSVKETKLFSNNSFEYLFISNQINLAKSHGIYAFGIFIYWYLGKIIFDKYINTFLECKSIKFHYLFIMKNRNIDLKYHKFLVVKKYEISFIQELKIFFTDKRYIKIGAKPVLCIDNNLKKIKKLQSSIQSLRNYSKVVGIGELFIIGSLKNKNISEIDLKSTYNAGYELLPNYLLKDNLLVNFKNNITFFAGLIYKDINFKNYDNFPIFRGSTLTNKLNLKNNDNFGDYYPEYFYMMNKFVRNWTITYHNDTYNFMFINSWNNYLNGAYLEPNTQFGYGSLNSFSKALFNLNFKNYTYNLSNLLNQTLIAVQIHIFYADLLNEIITSVNNIPVKFDLYITTNSIKKRTMIKDYLNKFSKAHNYKIKIITNNGRDILPLIKQMKNVLHKYKYFCHIHSKKSMHDPKYGLSWRKYLFKNLLGSSELISNILTDFENDEKLGFIFPETFYEAKVHALKLNKSLKYSINFLLNKIFKGYQIGKLLDFPAGDMFWAKSKAVYQMFKFDINKELCLERRPLTLLYALERLWLYIVKMNGYYYKKNCGYF